MSSICYTFSHLKEIENFQFKSQVLSTLYTYNHLGPFSKIWESGETGICLAFE